MVNIKLLTFAVHLVVEAWVIIEWPPGPAGGGLSMPSPRGGWVVHALSSRGWVVHALSSREWAVRALSSRGGGLSIPSPPGGLSVFSPPGGRLSVPSPPARGGLPVPSPPMGRLSVRSPPGFLQGFPICPDLYTRILQADTVPPPVSAEAEVGRLVPDTRHLTRLHTDSTTCNSSPGRRYSEVGSASVEVRVNL